LDGIDGRIGERESHDRGGGNDAVKPNGISGFAPQLLDGGGIGETVFMILGFMLLGISFGQSSGSVASNFSRAYRYTASALTSDLAWLFGAGFAPLAALILSSRFGLTALDRPSVAVPTSRTASDASRSFSGGLPFRRSHIEADPREAQVHLAN
jgi:hypothetical protein